MSEHEMLTFDDVEVVVEEEEPWEDAVEGGDIATTHLFGAMNDDDDEEEDTSSFTYTTSDEDTTSEEGEAEQQYDAVVTRTHSAVSSVATPQHHRHALFTRLDVLEFDADADPNTTVAPFIPDVLMYAFLFLPLHFKTLQAVRAVNMAWRFYAQYLPHWNFYEITIDRNFIIRREVARVEETYGTRVRWHPTRVPFHKLHPHIAQSPTCCTWSTHAATITKAQQELGTVMKEQHRAVRLFWIYRGLFLVAMLGFAAACLLSAYGLPFLDDMDSDTSIISITFLYILIYIACVGCICLLLALRDSFDVIDSFVFLGSSSYGLFCLIFCFAALPVFIASFTVSLGTARYQSLTSLQQREFVFPCWASENVPLRKEDVWLRNASCAQLAKRDGLVEAQGASVTPSLLDFGNTSVLRQWKLHSVVHWCGSSNTSKQITVSILESPPITLADISASWRCATPFLYPHATLMQPTTFRSAAAAAEPAASYKIAFYDFNATEYGVLIGSQMASTPLLDQTWLWKHVHRTGFRGPFYTHYYRLPQISSKLSLLWYATTGNPSKSAEPNYSACNPAAWWRDNATHLVMFDRRTENFPKYGKPVDPATVADVAARIATFTKNLSIVVIVTVVLVISCWLLLVALRYSEVSRRRFFWSFAGLFVLTFVVIMPISTSLCFFPSEAARHAYMMCDQESVTSLVGLIIGGAIGLLFNVCVDLLSRKCKR